MKRQNVLVLYTDQQRWDTLGVNGNKTIKTPNLDMLAKDGANFNNCYCQNPVCMPSRISMMTGSYCSYLGILEMATNVPEDAITIQKILKNYGYYNGLIGKIHYLPHSNRNHKELHPLYDFNHMELSDEPGCYEDAYFSWVKRKNPEAIDLISCGLPPHAEIWNEAMQVADNVKHPEKRTYKGFSEFRTDENLTHTAFVGEQTIEFIKSNSNRPFFCFSGFYSPHSPLIAPRKYLDMYEEDLMPMSHCDNTDQNVVKQSTKGYYAVITEVDYWVGQIIEELKKQNLYDDTIIIFTSDHGEWLGEHDKYGKGYWGPDVVSRVPLIIRGGPNKGTLSDIVECVDIVPTILNLIGIPIPPSVQGDDIFINDGDNLALTEGKGWKTLRSDKFKYVVNDNGKEMFFDLQNDPFEYKDLVNAENFQKLISEFRKLLLMRILRIEYSKKRDWIY